MADVQPGQQLWSFTEVTMTVCQVDSLVESFGRGLVSLGQQPGKAVCLYADTRMEWMVAAQVTDIVRIISRWNSWS